MNILLLSGGSGKRLWPLSNDVRSKQFIRIFRDAQGNNESMVQRVYRQITAVDPGAKVTVATSKTQVSSIRNQLGDAVSICVEPARRDTFPAIALATVYLQDVLGVDPEEPVIVCPVDPYVNNSYFEALTRLEKLVEGDAASLTLMGIEPTVPSKKYGYIIPQGGETVSPVKEFKEKPDKETAKLYIAQGALWNAGVFAFRLKYLIEKAHSMIDFTDYKDLFAKYETLTKISFDYAVVEKEPSIQVMRYAGEWKDVGSWNMMAEVMPEPTMGDVILDETCENVHVVNELEIPILVMGCKDLVVAASGDGILVSDKERSGAMKPYVEKIDMDARFAEKSWGTYTVIDAQPHSMTIKVHLRAGKRMTYHAHEMRQEIFTVVSGQGRIILGGVEQQLRTGNSITIPAGTKHIIIADTDMHAIEVQMGQEISAKDKTIYPLPEALIIK
ncbi:MAG: cupin domain-containing protein [Clostridia bacterium]|nr:cupin domain-containing protein [Clostridia bacterium]